MKLNQAVIQYPDCELKNGNIHIFGNKKEPWAVNSILGVGESLDSKEAEKYNFPNSDKQYSESAITESMDLNSIPVNEIVKLLVGEGFSSLFLYL